MRKRIIVSTFAVILLASCSGFDDSSLLDFPIGYVSEIKAKDATSLMRAVNISVPIYEHKFIDSLLISRVDQKPFLYLVSNARTDSLVGVFCEKGRGPAEPMDCTFCLDINKEEGITSGWFFSYQVGKFFKWNISQSIDQGHTVYDEIVPVKMESDGDHFLLASSFFYLTNSKMFLLNDRQDAVKEWMVEPPTFERYDLKSGEREAIFRPFKLYDNDDGESEDKSYSSRVFFSLYDDIKPSRDKVVFAFRYLPYLAIIDPMSGETRGVRIKGAPQLNTKRRYIHFQDIECDNSYIYCLYQGSPAEQLGDSPVSRLMIFNWDLELIANYSVGSVTAISLDGMNLYLLNQKYKKCYILSIDDLSEL